MLLVDKSRQSLNGSIASKQPKKPRSCPPETSEGLALSEAKGSAFCLFSTSTCHSEERSDEESVFAVKKKQIPRSARNDRWATFPPFPVYPFCPLQGASNRSH